MLCFPLLRASETAFARRFSSRQRDTEKQCGLRSTWQEHGNNSTMVMARQFIAIFCTVILVLAAEFILPAHAAGLALDGSCSSSGTTTVSCSITTTSTSDVIIVFVTTDSGTPQTPTGGGLTYNSRNTGSISGTTVAEFYATASSTLSSATVSDTISGGTTPTSTIIVFGVSGANTGSPFDPNLTTAPTPATGSSSIPTVTFSTTGTDDMLIGLAGMASSKKQTSGSCCVLIAENHNTRQSSAAEYALTTATGSHTIDFGLTVSSNWVMLGDAIVSPTGVPELPWGLIPILLASPIIYILLRRRVIHSEVSSVACNR
jgi:hypothetical protein